MIRHERTYYVIKLRCIPPEKGGKNGNRCCDTNYAPLAKKQRRIRNRRLSSEVRALSRREYYFRLKAFSAPHSLYLHYRHFPFRFFNLSRDLT